MIGVKKMFTPLLFGVKEGRKKKSIQRGGGKKETKGKTDPTKGSLLGQKEEPGKKEKKRIPSGEKKTPLP